MLITCGYGALRMCRTPLPSESAEETCPEVAVVAALYSVHASRPVSGLTRPYSRDFQCNNMRRDPFAFPSSIFFSCLLVIVWRWWRWPGRSLEEKVSGEDRKRPDRWIEICLLKIKKAERTRSKRKEYKRIPMHNHGKAKGYIHSPSLGMPILSRSLNIPSYSIHMLYKF